MNIQSKLFLKTFVFLLGVISLLLLYSCKTAQRGQHVHPTEDFFTVIKVKKLSREVYAIYAFRNDTTFKIISYYNGERPSSYRKLVKGACFQAHIYSQFNSLEDKLNVIPPCNEVLEFHGVTIEREFEHGIDDVWFCKELNGPYLQNK